MNKAEIIILVIALILIAIFGYMLYKRDFLMPKSYKEKKKKKKKMPELFEQTNDAGYKSVHYDYDDAMAS